MLHFTGVGYLLLPISPEDKQGWPGSRIESMISRKNLCRMKDLVLPTLRSYQQS
jgi:hypothetical protein